MSRSTLPLALILGSLILPGSAAAGDWPQILGPHRNGVARDEKLADSWPQAGPTLAWEKKVGSGYAGVAVLGPRVYLHHRIGETNYLEALSAQTGETLWKEGLPTTFKPSVGGGDGPLCVPTVAGEFVITYSPQGLLVVRNAETGKLAWKRPTHQEFGAQEGYFGAGSTPLVAGNVVIVNVGGWRMKAGVVGFDLKTGATLWKQVEDHASYSAPVLVRNGDRQLAIVITRLKCVALNPANGELIWEIPFGQRGPTVNAALPVHVNGRIFLTASYGTGAVLLDSKPDSAEILWADTETLASQYATPIESDGLLFGFHGRDDIPPSELRCIDPVAPHYKQRVLWSVPDMTYGTMIKADGKLIIVQTDGELVLANLSRDKFSPQSRFKASTGILRALPALANGGLYIRDETTLKRYAVGK